MTGTSLRLGPGKNFRCGCMAGRLFTAPYFFVTSFRYTASYRQMYWRVGVGDYSSVFLASLCFCWSRVFICSLLFSIHSMAWQATFDVITSWPFLRPPWKTGGKSLYALVPFWSWNTLQHYLVDVMMKQKSFFVQGNLNFALIEIISSFQYLFFAIEWTAKFTENIGLLAI